MSSLISDNLARLKETLRDVRLVSILYGVSYQGNAGSCYRTANIVGSNIPTILVPPDGYQLQQEGLKRLQQGFAKLKRYHTNKYVNHFILTIIWFINLLINTGDKLRSYFPCPYDCQGLYYKRFVQDTVFFSAQRVNKKDQDVASPLFYNISWDQLLPLLFVEGFQICLVENDSRYAKQNLYRYGIDSETRYALVMGSEIAGLPEQALQSGDQIFIPTYHSKSLNVSVAHGIVLTYFNEKVQKI